MKAEMPRLPPLRPSAGEDQGDVGILPGGDELLGAVEHVAIAAQFGPALQRGGVRTAVRLGQTKSAQLCAGCERTQIALLLRVRAVFEDRHAADRVVPAHDGGACAVASGDLLQSEGVGDIVGARPTPFRRHRHAHEAELAHLAQRLAREGRGALPLGGVGSKLRPGKIPRRRADHLLFFGQDHGKRCLNE